VDTNHLARSRGKAYDRGSERLHISTSYHTILHTVLYRTVFQLPNSILTNDYLWQRGVSRQRFLTQ